MASASNVDIGNLQPSIDTCDKAVMSTTAGTEPGFVQLQVLLAGL